MSVSSPTARTAVVISALPQTIPVFEFNVAADLIVYDGGASNTANNPAVILQLGSDYTVTGGGYNASNQLQTGNIVVVGTGANLVQIGDTITVLRNITPLQDTTFASTGLQTPLMIEQDDDTLTTLVQELLDKTTRAMRAPPQENLDWVLPNAANRIASFPYFDGSGNLTTITLASVVAAATAGTTPVAANKVYAGPTTGAASTPTFRSLVAADFTGLTGFALAGPVGSSNLTQSTGTLLGRTTATTGAIEQITPGTSLTFAAGALNVIQDVRTTASPQFNNMGLGVAADSSTGLHVKTPISASGVGLYGEAQFTATANTQSFVGSQVSPALAQAGYTGLDYKGHRIGTPNFTGGGTVATSTQLYIDAAGAGTATYGIYQAGTDLNLLGGLLSIAGKTPATSGATGVQGTIAWDASYIYIATGTNAWKRAAIATW